MLNITRNQGHFEPANNYQRYNVLHSGTINYGWKAIFLEIQVPSGIYKWQKHWNSQVG